MSHHQPPKKTSINTELAKERNRAAAERTLMAWIRTCLALISFGFGLEQIVAALQRSQWRNGIDPLNASKILGLGFIGVGTLAMLAASLDHRQELKHIASDDYLYRHRPSIGLFVSISLVIIGFLAFIAILTQ